MAKKLGPPPRATVRQLTPREAAAVGVSHRLYVRVGLDNVITLMKSWRRGFLVVQLSLRDHQRLQRVLRQFWARDSSERGIYVSPEVLRRVEQVAQDGLACAGLSARGRSGLEWLLEKFGGL